MGSKLGVGAGLGVEIGLQKIDGDESKGNEGATVKLFEYLYAKKITPLLGSAQIPDKFYLQGER